MKLLVVLCVCLCGVAASGCIDPRSLGAVPGGQENVDQNTAALRKALSMASAASSCVNVTGGDYVTEDLTVSSNTVLYIGEDSRLLVGLNKTKSALVHVWNADNVTITGGGQLYGNAEFMISYYSAIDDRFQPWNGYRPHLLLVENCSNVVIDNIHLRNSSNWNMRLRSSRGILVDHCTVYGSHQYPNNDGIDPESSIDVTIRNSAIDVADDGVCPKATAGLGPLQNLYVHNTTIRSKSHAIKFGSNTDEDMFDIVFDDIEIWDSNAGLSIQQRSQGDIHNVTWSNIRVETRYVAPRWWGNGEWATISAEPREVNATIGRLYDLHFVNISALSENGGLFSGVAHGLQNLTLTNVDVTIRAKSNYSMGVGPPCMNEFGGQTLPCMGTWDHRPSDQEDHCSYYCREPGQADGVYLQNVQGARLSNVSVTYQAPALPWYGQCFAQDSLTTGVTNEGSSCSQ